MCWFNYVQLGGCFLLADHRWPQCERQEAIIGKGISVQEDSKCKGLETRIQLECSFKEQNKDWAVWDVEAEGENDGDDTEDGGRCYILLELY